MTDEEKEKLKGLEKDDLIDMLSALKDKAAANEQEFAAQRSEIMRDFLCGKNGNATPVPADDEEDYDPGKDMALQRLKNKYKGR